MVGNKSDLNPKPPQDKNFKNHESFLTSAKTGSNVNKVFSQLTEKILKKINKG
jgi:hypothetical protein